MRFSLLITCPLFLFQSGLAAVPKPEGKTVQATSTAGAVSQKVYQDPRNQFQVSYPGTWIHQTLEKGKETPALVLFAKPDQTVMVNVMLAKNNAGNSALDFLRQMDQSRKATNKLPENQRKLSVEELKKSGADDGALGLYEFPGQKPVLQRTLILKRKGEVFVVSGTYQKGHLIENEPLVQAVFASFQFLTVANSATAVK